VNVTTLKQRGLTFLRVTLGEMSFNMVSPSAGERDVSSYHLGIHLAGRLLQVRGRPDRSHIYCVVVPEKEINFLYLPYL
jgi:hypothetical protein